MRALLLSPGLPPVAATPLPMECVLTSEEVPSIQVRLKERTVTSKVSWFKTATARHLPDRNPPDTGLSGGPLRINTPSRMERQCSSRMTSTGIDMDQVQQHQRRTEFCS